MKEKIVQTAGRDQLGEFAPLFAHLNDDVLFGEVWNQDALDTKTKCIITVTALMASGITDSSLKYHLTNAKNHGVSRAEAVAVITHAAMYVGWPKGWAVFRLAMEVWGKEETEENSAPKDFSPFPLGEKNPYGQFFTGQSYLAPLSQEQIPVFSVTFEPGCRNNWHIHKAARGGGQMLICTAGEGWYQEWEKAPRALKPGDVVNIEPGVKHWHGAKANSWFQHIAIEVPGDMGETEWREPVDDARYSALEKEGE